MQLDMFPQLQDMDIKVQSYKDSSDRVRRGVFARLDSVKKEVDDKLKSQQDQLECFAKILEDIQIMYSTFGLEKSA